MITLPREITKHHHQVCKTLEDKWGRNAYLRGIEIGTKAGDLTKALLAYFPNLELTTMDPWLHQPGEGFEAGNKQDYHNQQKAQALKCLHPFGDRVKIYELTSDEAFKVLRDEGMVDFVHIDGHHTTEQVTKDINNYIQLVQYGGLIGGHDYRLVPDVTVAVDAIFKEGVQTGADFTYWVHVERNNYEKCFNSYSE